LDRAADVRAVRTHRGRRGGDRNHRARIRLVRRGVAEKFTDDLAGGVGRGVVRLGQVGYIDKGIAFAIVGGLFGGPRSAMTRRRPVASTTLCEQSTLQRSEPACSR
jgi:hypothetical protein